MSVTRRHVGRRAAAWLVAGGLVVAFGAGCSSDDRSGPAHTEGARPRPSISAPTTGDCVGRVDALIDSRTIPRADRDYAIGMCQAGR
ncbi:hypothetical protein ACVW00_002762 [Marmoricola sp. URHA0025 HA25]